jgi:hypothetical protein
MSSCGREERRRLRSAPSAALDDEAGESGRAEGSHEEPGLSPGRVPFSAHLLLLRLLLIPLIRSSNFLIRLEQPLIRLC